MVENISRPFSVTIFIWLVLIIAVRNFIRLYRSVLHWDFLLDVLSRYDNDVIGSFEMCPCMPAVMIRQASEYMFDILKWPDRPRAKMTT